MSFDGSGYLFVDQLLGVNEQTILLILRASVLPRDDKDALIFYAYDSTVCSRGWDGGVLVQLNGSSWRDAQTKPENAHTATRKIL